MSRNTCNGENGEKSPASGDLNGMPKVAPWRLAILAKTARGLAIIAINVPDPWRLAILTKMAIVAKLAILAKIARNACYGANGKKLPAFSLSSRTYLLEKRSPKSSNESRNVQQLGSAILKSVKSLISLYVNFHEMSLVPDTSPH